MMTLHVIALVLALALLVSQAPNVTTVLMASIPNMDMIVLVRIL